MKVLSHQRYKQNSIDKISSWNIKDIEKKKVKEYIKLYETGSITGRLPSNPDALIERVLQLLRPCLENCDPTPDGVEKFKSDLLKDKIKSQFKKPYSMKVKKGMFGALSSYYEWRYPEEARIIKPLNITITLKENDDFETFSIPNEADKLRDDCGSIERRGIFSLLMSGARIEELLNITEQDIKLPEGNESFTQITIKNNLSKTKGRTIKIYYTPASKDISEYIRMKKNEGIKPNEPLIQLKYSAINEFIESLGNKHNKKIRCHTYRHSVATWLASKLNRSELAYYFGWKFSSNMPDKYISRNGFTIKEADKKIENENIIELKSKLDKQDFDNKMIQEKMEEVKKENEKKFRELYKKLEESIIKRDELLEEGYEKLYKKQVGDKFEEAMKNKKN